MLADGSTPEQQPRRPPGRPFPKGVSGNPGGMPKGVAEVKALARQWAPRAIETLVDIMLHGQHERARIAAAEALLDRGFGKPTQPLAGDPEMPPLQIVVTPEVKRAIEALGG
ncbi:MAG: hypothetical protein QJR08_03720 [Bacillota bacterium]|nr:hypothetical protein [Bacillota bacterium]